MIFPLARGLFSTLHGTISTGLDVLIGIAPKPRDTMNQEQSAKTKARDARIKTANAQTLKREEARRREETHGVFGKYATKLA